MKKCPNTRYAYITFPRYYLVCFAVVSSAVALVFTAVLHIFTRGGDKVGAHSKDEVLPQPDESILSGGTVQWLMYLGDGNLMSVVGIIVVGYLMP